MREHQEIRQVYDDMVDLSQILERKRDSFEYGLLIGKLVALGWVLGEESNFELRTEFDFEDWQQECNALKDKLRKYEPGTDTITDDEVSER